MPFFDEEAVVALVALPAGMAPIVFYEIKSKIILPLHTTDSKLTDRSQ